MSLVVVGRVRRTCVGIMLTVFSLGWSGKFDPGLDRDR
ncbi:hypothetical protein B005_4404 [Nocardiopsis alba ATCC BAA-2165]|uniref:Uncharacterized protein n=1 Tax=Nocardiopsis alba (strain ATCC BAA-2165 / BE74) TaxID=1205910 RepID=J7LB71_NOCAA|nr:hypothetical protein B005_4404 [Nocardiopsis alba ATCC BAA-2165]